MEKESFTNQPHGQAGQEVKQDRWQVRLGDESFLSNDISMKMFIWHVLYNELNCTFSDEESDSNGKRSGDEEETSKENGVIL